MSSTLAAGGETDHGIPLDGRRKQIVDDSMALFQSKPSLDIFKRGWREDAVFEDPISLATGFKQYSASVSQWFGMPKAFPKSETLAWKVTKSEPGLLEYEQRQKYTFAGIGTTKEVPSLVHIELDSEDYITRFEDRWNGKPIPAGTIAKGLRNFNAETLPHLVSVPKE
ncbi:hypothetical protein MNV49_004955 [Pseudohyphozyma bogoriensis]|nr:hypothetical protein MNV49_004955 [Pseudohyphozyma bogoriensis]